MIHLIDVSNNTLNSSFQIHTHNKLELNNELLNIDFKSNLIITHFNVRGLKSNFEL